MIFFALHFQCPIIMLFATAIPSSYYAKEIVLLSLRCHRWPWCRHYFQHCFPPANWFLAHSPFGYVLIVIVTLGRFVLLMLFSWPWWWIAQQYSTFFSRTTSTNNFYLFSCTSASEPLFIFFTYWNMSLSKFLLAQLCLKLFVIHSLSSWYAAVPSVMTAKILAQVSPILEFVWSARPCTDHQALVIFCSAVVSMSSSQVHIAAVTWAQIPVAVVFKG